MKGQHLALESVATFTLTLVAAVGIVQVFGDVSQRTIQTSQDAQAEVIANEVRDGLLQLSLLKQGSRGYVQLELPETIGGESYQMSLEKGRLSIFTEQTEYEKNFNLAGPKAEMSGAVEGGDIRIYRIGNQYTLRDDR